MNDQLEKKTLKGSGGHVVANLTSQEIKNGGVVGVDIFLGAVGRIEEKRILEYFCKKCNKEFGGTPKIKYEKLNEEVAKGHTLSEQGAYICKQCESIIAQYKTFAEQDEKSHDYVPSRTTYEQEGFVDIRKLIGMDVYDNKAVLAGTIKDIGFMDKKSKIVVLISTTENTEKEISWDAITSIGDVVLINIEEQILNTGSSDECKKCGLYNSNDSKFCEQCGTSLK
ncbi:MAG: hypothetical protein EX285_03560 [Thaumarchaeota archaeon]|nr:hypothetical protein [Nitrososphaerota archaeon]